MRTVAGADKIVVLKDGKVAQQGNLAELTNYEEIYRNMVEAQTKSISWKYKPHKKLSVPMYLKKSNLCFDLA